ncbi:ankyrin [Lindgomyces ingoldianus]|uniref:Ankyrin n=1 Tax=Lindgomyces ingoldianus TaxID=673940 RepID=A0ACB6QRK5_9PLEO|nr:ankyrin [Lindgomyces ingoldianus]KAF2469629.1 ankyrin [Lindgomyces ingoldianus]
MDATQLSIKQRPSRSRQLLLENGADVAGGNNNAWTPLNSASYNGHLEIVKLLLEKGAEVTGANKDGWTLLLRSASNNGHLEIFKLLLESVSDVNSLDGHYGSILHVFAFKGYTDLLRLAYNKYHANRSLTEYHGRTPLQLASRGGHFDTFQYLISLGLDPSTRDEKGEGLLHYAASGGSLQILNAVLKNVLVSSLQRGYWSPIHWACRAGNPNVIERLINEGLRSECISISQPEGQWSPISIAIFHGNEKMLEELSTSCRSLLDVGLHSVRLRGIRHGSYWCNGCFHDIYGPRFHCRTCPNFDYCFMCKPFLDHIHKDHEWDYVESHFKPSA